MRAALVSLKFLAGLMLLSTTVASAAALPPGAVGGLADAHAGATMEVRHRCVPSRCGCRGFQTTFCTRDCRRDRHCRCVGGRYVCRYFR